MAPNKKKKKPVSNPARGFATVSQPSKSKATVNELSKPESNQEIADMTYCPSGKAEATGQDSNKSYLALQQMSPEELQDHLEDAELQNILDVHSSHCKHDAAKQVTRLKTERRQLRQEAHRLSTFKWLSDETISEVLQRKAASRYEHPNEQLGELFDETNLLLKAWTIRIVLVTLGFPNIHSAIDYVLMHAPWTKLTPIVDYVWGLQEAFEWYAVECPSKDLPQYEQEPTAKLTKSVGDDIMSSSIRKHLMAPDIDISCSSTGHQSAWSVINDAKTDKLDSMLSVRNSFEVKLNPENDSSNDDCVQEDEECLTPLSSSSSDADEPSSLIDRYLKLRALLYKTEVTLPLTGKKGAVLDDRKFKLQKRIESIRRDVLFDAHVADATWMQQFRELKIETAKSSKSNKDVLEVTDVIQETSNDLDDGEDVLGQIFGGDEDDTGLVTTSSDQSTVRIVEFGKWTGVQPRRLMEETAHHFDGQCQVKFKTLMTTSVSTRQMVELQWSTTHSISEQALSVLSQELTCFKKPNLFVLEMTSVAAATPAQAESYLSTVVLFVLEHSNNMDYKQSSRLPSVWRNFYNDLVQAQRLLIDAADKETLRDLRKLILSAEQRLKDNRAHAKTLDRSLQIPTDLSGRETKENLRLTAEEAKQKWDLKTSTHAYRASLKARMRLPIFQCKDEILQAVDSSRLLIICADTGAGKSTQIPSFILEHELSHGNDCKILVTQPRRISAISLARRVSQELGEQKSDIGTNKSVVGYAIRLESKTSRSTRITFATTGVLLRMIEVSPELDDLDYIVLDEVHERNMDTDLLFIVLKRLLHKRSDLKVVLMSATLDAQKFSLYFDGAPVLNIPGRTFPVEVQYLEDAIEETIDKEPNKPKGANFANNEFQSDEEEERVPTDVSGLNQYSSQTRSKLAQIDEYCIDYDLVTSLAEAIVTKERFVRYSSAILIFMPGIAEIRRLHNALLTRETFTSNWIIHLLHSTFLTEELERAFSVPAPGYRKIVIATNIAETGITIPDITAVIDTCKEKTMRFDERRQLSRLTESFISRASARQRRGRAARVQEGLCFHLVTRYRFENLMLEQHVPEMLRLSLQDPVLRIKVWNLGSIEETLTSAIDPPTSKNIRRAVEKLKDAGALSSTEELTKLGQKIARLPLDVALSKLAIFGIVFQCLDAVLVIIAVLSSKSPFLGNQTLAQLESRLAFARGDSDLLSTLNAYQGWRRARVAGSTQQFCQKHHLNDQNLSAIEDQKIQLLVYLIDAGFLQFGLEEKTALNRSRVVGNRKPYFNVPERYNVHESDPMLNCVIAMAFYPKILVREGKGWRNIYSNQRVSLTSQSINRASDKPPKWLCFYEAIQTKSGSLTVVETSKVPEIVMITLTGNAEMRYFSGVIGLDNGRVRFSLGQWQQLAAIKTLRDSLAAVLDRCWRNPGLEVFESDQGWIELFAGLMAATDTKLKHI